MHILSKSVALLVCILCLAAVSARAAHPLYTVHPISLPVDKGVGLFGMNDVGQFVGFMGDAAFVWTPDSPNGFLGHFIELPSAGGLATGINDSGQIVGRSGGNAVLWNPSSSGAGYEQPLAVTSSSSTAAGINSYGQIVGSDTQGTLKGFVWTPDVPNGSSGTTTFIPSLPGAAFSYATSINDLGQVAGSSGKALLWQPTAPNSATGAVHSLNLSQPTNGSQNYINEAGQIAGNRITQNSDRAFVWTPNSPNAPVGSTDSILGMTSQSQLLVTGINDSSTVVGYDVMTSSAFVWSPDNNLSDLNSILDAASSGWNISSAHAINEGGNVLAWGTTLDSNGLLLGSVVLLTPVPVTPGDINGDGRVDLADFGILKAHFGTGTAQAQGDLNGNGQVDLTDFGILKENFGKIGQTAVPEPSTWALALLGTLGLILLVLSRRPCSRATLGWR